MAMAESSTPPHVVAIPLPAQGHLNPLMRFCKALAYRHGFIVTFVNVDPIHHTIKSLHSQQDEESDIAKDVHGGIRRAHVPISNDFRMSSVKQFHQAVVDLNVESLACVIANASERGPPVTCIISDVFMSTSTQKVADKLGLPRVAFFPFSQAMNLFFFYISRGVISMQKAILASVERDNPNGLFFQANEGDDAPGLPTSKLRIADMPAMKYDSLEESDFLYPFFVSECEIAYSKAHCLAFNSFLELEAPAFHAFSTQLNGKHQDDDDDEVLKQQKIKPVYCIGPLSQDLVGEAATSLWKEDDDICMPWLDQQAPLSVLYISFGSLTLLSQSQMVELLAGIQDSQQKFLWACRPDLVEFDPAHHAILQDFIEHTRDRGSMVSWAPQLKVLSHSSIGGFLTHSGWNSTIESITSGVPMLCWPYFGDQFLNAMYVVEEWHIGMHLKANDCGLVDRIEVERVAKALMASPAGEEVRENAGKLKQLAQKSLQDGSSCEQMHAFVKAITTFNQHI